MKIAIAGAGIVGTSAACALQAQGHAVTLIDAEGFAAQASGRNAGWIAHVDILPLASSKAWRHVPGWLIDPLGPLTIRPSYVPALLPWILRFLAASTPTRVAASSEAIAALNLAALPAWERLLAPLGLVGMLRKQGQLSVWTDAGAFDAFAPLAARQRALGIRVETVDAATIAKLEPAFAKAAGQGAIAGGAVYPDTAHVADPADLTRAMGEAALGRGADLKIGKVAGFERHDAGVAVRLADGTSIACDRAVLALGAWSKKLAGLAGDDVPLDTERGYNITVPPGTLGLSRPVTYQGHGFVTTPLDTGDRIGGAVEFAGLEAPANEARIDAIVGKLRRFLPDLGPLEGVNRLCFRPSIPDSLPVIGPSRNIPGLIYAFGHGHYGLTQAAITAELIAALVGDTASPVPLAAYSARRF
jgi:D-amino-acid dehydrogenase